MRHYAGFWQIQSHMSCHAHDMKYMHIYTSLEFIAAKGHWLEHACIGESGLHACMVYTVYSYSVITSCKVPSY